MAVFFEQHAQWLGVALVVIAVVVAMTVYGFWRKRYADRGYKKGEAKNPQHVRKQNPPERPMRHLR